MKEKIREPVVHGMFYPAKKDSLLKMISTMLSEADSKLKENATLFGLISPHAGYVYSGPCAAYGYKLIKNSDFTTIIILGPAHTTFFNGASVWSEGFFRTPLGEIPVDEECCKMLIKYHSSISFYPLAHIEEHSIEVQLPFLQYILKDRFKIVPVVIGNQSIEYSQILSEALCNLLTKMNEKKFLIIASSDLSHYHSDQVARRLDNTFVEAIKTLDPNEVNEVIESGKSEACGVGPVLVLLYAAKKMDANIIEILNLTNSGEVSGDKSRVVGYLSAAIYKSKIS